MAERLKRLPAMQETWVRSLGWEETLEEGMATYSGIPAWRIPGTEEPGRLQSMGSQRVARDTTERPLLQRLLFGEGNGTPFQYSCLENPMDEGAW